MTNKPLITLLSVAFLSLSSAAIQAQAPAAPPPPPDGAAAPITRSAPRQARGPQQERMGRDMRGGKMDGPNPGARISPPGMWWKSPDVISKLTLTDDQQKKMDGIFQQSRLQLIDLKANVEKQEVTLEPMLDVNPPDTAKVLAQIERVAKSRSDLEVANARMLLGIRGVLTADQWTKLQAERGSHHMGFKGPGGPGGPGRPGGPDGMMGGPGGHHDMHFTTPDTLADAPPPPADR